MSHFIREVHGPGNADTIRLLNSQDELFPPLTNRHLLTGFWWLAFDEYKTPIAFAGMVPNHPHDSWYLKRCYVAPWARGHGLQRKLLRLREVKASELGIRQLVGECPAGSQSETNFVKAEYERVDPEQKWGAPDSVYFSKRIKPRIS